ncbi:Ubiquitinyl hydrolase 1 protein [Dioscorea alata]|uniref:Ubiquitinyl hydrolase 1 protein n=3 Tax=Dioscorea alata TaxID=55571 RepID=A0ACB7W438_DIOAL|nr:Ubiquitinyl hydrolase 1 protein [Dioscorea alata]KAH7682267.1 Ubiquitinyl hydrolase 1 protein [Dioscorea alata]KAH7682268.1 Ubiquitinyl hydrolase 1 protein [Dioscorea alata]
MLQPREADLPVLFLVLIVLPVVTYILLGRWTETAKKKNRISLLAQLASEEAFRVEAMTSVDVIPPLVSSKTGFYVCARCFAPATTRCSKCKSIRYCSGKCQIIHWRQVHKQECQMLQDSRLNNLSGSLASVSESAMLEHSIFENSKPQFLDDDREELLLDSAQHSAAGKKLLEKSASKKLKREKFRNDGYVSCSKDETINCDLAPTTSSSTLSEEVSLEGVSARHKLGTENHISASRNHRSQDTTSQIFSHAPNVLRNILHQSHKSTGKMMNVSKSKGSPILSTSLSMNRNAMSEHETDMEFSSEEVNIHNGKAYSASEELDLTSAGEKAKGSLKYKKPPYTVGTISSLSQKLADEVPKGQTFVGIARNTCVDDESRIQQSSISKSIPSDCFNRFSVVGSTKTDGSRKSSKIPKGKIAGLLNYCKKNKVLFPYEDLVKLFQCEIWDVSPRGLLNCGNSCYANAVLQCLTCTKPIMVYLLQRLHSRTCCVKDWCLMCELEQHVSMLREGGGPLSPNGILSNMRNIGWRMGGGNQEDAHEFLRLLLMSMQTICLEGLGGEKNVDCRLQETTLIQQIFGGRLRSKVKCMRCHLESERYENIMDLTLEIHGWVESLEDALTQFTAAEDLDGENMYRCGRCSTYVNARKQLSIHEVPNILTVVLKRFQTGQYGKINKCVTFPDMLDMIPFVTGTADIPPLYMLYAVVVHLDTLNASFSGHYVSYVKDLQGAWFRVDDAEVQAVPSSRVMSEGAYMLFYARSFPRPPRVYTEKASLQAKAISRPTTAKAHKSSEFNDGQRETLSALGNRVAMANDFIAENRGSVGETFSDSFSMDFSDATSSDWSLFTSSDESSFTTESTRNSFSTVDYGDAAGLDPIASLFSPYYGPEYPISSTISCTKFSPCKVETRFVSESKAFVVDSSKNFVHRGQNLEPVNLSSGGRYKSSRKD